MDRVIGAFNRKIDIIGVEHGKGEQGVREKLVHFAQAHPQVVLAGEGCAYDGEPGGNGFYGIEDRRNLISNYTNILIGHRKACSFLENRAKLKPCIEALESPHCPDEFRNSVEKTLKDQSDLLGSYTCAIFQLFIEADNDIDKSQPLSQVIEKVKGYLQKNQKPEYALLCKFERDIFPDKACFHTTSYERGSHENYPRACMAFFEENKAAFDRILPVIVLHLSEAIKEEFSAVDEIKNHEGLSEINITNFFNDPRATEFAEDTAENLRNLVFAASLKEIANKANSEDMICVVVGKKHMSGVKEILTREKIFNIGTYNAVKNKLPEYLISEKPG